MNGIKADLIFLVVCQVSALIFDIPPSSSQVQEESYVDEIKFWKSSDKEEEKRLRFSAFGKEFDLALEKTDGIFAEDFKILSSTDDSTRFRDHDKEKLVRGSFYTIKDSVGSVYVEERNNGLHVEGIIDNDLRLLPSNDLSENDLITHRALKLHPLPRETELFANDYVNFDRSFVVDEVTDRQRSEPRDTAYIESLVVFDYNNSAALKFKKKRIYKYLGIFWNSVQKHYSVFDQPKIRFVITGVWIMTDPNDEMFLRKILDENKVDGMKVLNRFGEWLYNMSNPLPHFDMAFLQTGLDLVEGEVDLLGVAYLYAICEKNYFRDNRYKMLTCAEGEDRVPLYTGVLTAVHEIGHLLGSDHDGPNSDSLCADDGYIMSSIEDKGKLENAYKFSNCSKKEISKFINNSKRSCIWNKPKNELFPLIKEIPRTNRHKVCQWMFGPDSFALKKQNNICKKLLCFHPKRDTASISHPPEGTTCARNSICFEGKCKRIIT